MSCKLVKIFFVGGSINICNCTDSWVPTDTTASNLDLLDFYLIKKYFFFVSLFTEKSNLGFYQH